LRANEGRLEGNQRQERKGIEEREGRRRHGGRKGRGEVG